LGTIKVVPNRFVRARDVLILQTELWAVAYMAGRKMVSVPLARTGDSVRRQISAQSQVKGRRDDHLDENRRRASFEPCKRRIDV
jgi:hypothetical protein